MGNAILILAALLLIAAAVAFFAIKRSRTLKADLTALQANYDSLQEQEEARKVAMEAKRKKLREDATIRQQAKEVTTDEQAMVFVDTLTANIQRL